MKRIFGAAAMLWAWSSVLSAQTVTMRFEAQVEMVDDPGYSLGGAIQPGQTLTGTYVYDASTPDGNPTPGIASYRHTSAPFGVSVQAGSLTFETDPNTVDFTLELQSDHPFGDSYRFNSLYNRSSLSAIVVDSILWQLDDGTGQALASEALTDQPPALGQWQSLMGLVVQGRHLESTAPFFIRAHMTSVEKVVPTPTLGPNDVAIRFEAQVAEVADPDDLLNGAIQPGQNVVGTYVYDHTTANTNPSPGIGDYVHTRVPYGVSLQVGGMTFETDPTNVDFQVELISDHPSGTDNYLWISRNNRPISPSFDLGLISWQLDDPTGQRLSSPALTDEPPVLADWQSIIGLTINGTQHHGTYFLSLIHI